MSASKNEEMRAKLYLGDISQEKIKPGKIVRPLAEYFKPDASLVICCDAFCCILDCDRPGNYDDIIYPQDKRWAPELVLRREKFGGLIWNRKTGHVWQISEKATKICYDFAKGADLGTVCKKHEVTESDLFTLLADVSQRVI